MNVTEELIAVCRGITADGDLTDKELYALAEWLNSHPEACEVWPGTVLVKPLQDAWADGKINKTELRTLGRLLSKIEKEWGARQARQIGEEALRSFTLSEPRLPLVDLQCEVLSSDGQRYYILNLADASCSCPDWMRERGHVPAGSVSRCCKHIASALRKVAPEGDWPGWLGALLADCVFRGRGSDPGARWAVISVGGHELLIGIGTSGWANVYASEEFGDEVHVDDETWEGTGETRFGYNYLEGRWAYSTAPMHARTIVKAIKSML